MEELSIEEKAKRYDEVVARLRHAFNSNRCTLGFMNEILRYPKESEDERIRKALIRFHKSTIDVDGIKGDDVLVWLEKQGNLTDGDMKEWSKEDEQIKEDILYDLNTLLEGSKSEWAIKDLKKEINWLESLKPQNHWKPSDEQMEALKQAKTDACGKPYFNALASLYVNLQ